MQNRLAEKEKKISEEFLKGRELQVCFEKKES